MAALLDFSVLLLMEILLGIDNIVFVNLIVKQTPNPRLSRATGLFLALVMRIVMLCGADFLIKLDHYMLLGIIPLKMVIFFSGGVFLLIKGLQEIYYALIKNYSIKRKVLAKPKKGMFKALFSIILVDLVFSIDSITAALGITKDVTVIIYALIVTGVVMVLFAEYLNHIISSVPSLNIVAMGFIAIIGLKLILEGADVEVNNLWLYLVSAL